MDWWTNHYCGFQKLGHFQDNFGTLYWLFFTGIVLYVSISELYGTLFGKAGSKCNKVLIQWFFLIITLHASFTSKIWYTFVILKNQTNSFYLSAESMFKPSLSSKITFILDELKSFSLYLITPRKRFSKSLQAARTTSLKPYGL